MLVRFSEEQRNSLVQVQKVLCKTYLSFMSWDNADIFFELPSLGDDFCPAYGYTQEHHTGETWLWLLRQYAEDVIKNGTPASCRRLTDLIVSFWNKCMGNVDTVRNVVKEQMAKRGPDSGPGSLTWSNLLDYILYQAFRTYQHGQIESKLDTFVSFKQLQEHKFRSSSFSAYLWYLCDRDSFNPSKMQEFFPGLCKLINRGGYEDENHTGMGICTRDSSSVPTLIAKV